MLKLNNFLQASFKFQAAQTAQAQLVSNQFPRPQLVSRPIRPIPQNPSSDYHALAMPYLNLIPPHLWPLYSPLQPTFKVPQLPQLPHQPRPLSPASPRPASPPRRGPTTSRRRQTR